MAYDSKCQELAIHFLGKDAPLERIWALSQEIQDSIETWLQTFVGEARHASE